MGSLEAYVERPPLPSLARAVRTVWVQHTGPGPYAQRNLPTGGAELQCRIGSVPRLVGPLTTAKIDVLPAATTIVGVRFWPGTAAALLGIPAEELVDLAVPLDEVWGDGAVRLGELLASTASSAGPETALGILQNHLALRRAVTTPPDPLVAAAVRRLMPWDVVHVGALTTELDISTSQLRRRFLSVVGVTPKTLQRTLRFQGYLAFAQAAADDGVGGGRLADLAAKAGYADQPHLTRECLRLTGLTPRQLLRGREDRCGCGHDHSASYQPFLAGRRGSAPRP